MKNNLYTEAIALSFILFTASMMVAGIIAFIIDTISEISKFNHGRCKCCNKRLKLIGITDCNRIYHFKSCACDILVHNYIADYKYLKETNILKGQDDE